ncbi:hypothetical protein VTI28DRAFT_8482 [Corynascus sepedonium]
MEFILPFESSATQSRRTSSLLLSLAGDCGTCGPVPTHHQAPLCRSSTPGLRGRSKNTPVSKGDETARVSHRLCLSWTAAGEKTSRLQIGFGIHAPNLDQPSRPAALDVSKLALSPCTLSLFAAFPENCPRPLGRQLCHRENRAPPIELWFRRRLCPLCALHRHQITVQFSGRQKPAGSRSKALHQSNAKSTDVSNRFTQPCLSEALLIYPSFFSFFLFLLFTC